MTYLYAIYLTFCVLGQPCIANNMRIDTFETVKPAQYEIEAIGENPHWEMVNDDLVYMYSNGECYKGRTENYHDLMLWLEVLHGADCEDCVDSMDDKE